MVNITRQIMTSNLCYLDGRKINPTGIMFHTTATPSIMAGDWFSRWNNNRYEVGVHFFVDDTSIYQYLPCEKGNVHRAWHAGGAANNSHISIELCEPLNPLSNAVYFNKAYNNMLDLCEHLCKLFGITADNIIGHCEGYQKGIASNHADPNHYLPKMGKTLDQFRAEIKRRLTSSPSQKPEISVLYRIRKSWTDSKSQIGAYKDLNNAIIKAKGNMGYSVFDNNGKQVYPTAPNTSPSVPNTTIYRVRTDWGNPSSQVGAYGLLQNAINKAKENSLYKVYDSSGNQVYPTVSPTPTTQFGRVNTDILNVRSGASITSNVIGQLTYGTQVKIAGKVGTWYSLYYGNHGGFVHSDYISLQ